MSKKGEHVMKKIKSQTNFFLEDNYTLFDKISICWHRFVWNYFRDWYYECKYGFQRMFRGYDDKQVFNLDLELIKHIHKILKAFRKDCISYPNQLTYEEWLSILDEMILCFQEAHPETCSLINDIEYDVAFLHRRQGKGFFNIEAVYPTEEDKEKKELYFQKEKEISDYQMNNLNKGIKLLSTHLRNIWQ